MDLNNETLEKFAQAESVFNTIGTWDAIQFSQRGKGLSYENKALTDALLRKMYVQNRGELNWTNPPFIAPTELLSIITQFKTVERSQNLSQYCATVGEFVDRYLKDTGVCLRPDGIIFHSSGDKTHEISLGELKNLIAIAAEAYNTRAPAETYRIPHNIAQIQVEDWLRQEREARITELRSLLIYDPTLSQGADVYAHDLLQIYGVDPSQENIAAFKHIIWQIKRKLFNHYKIPYPLFLCLQGRQNVGKSDFFHRLCTGFEWIFSDQGTLRQMLSGKELKAMIRGKYLVDCQELCLPINMWEQAEVTEAVARIKSVLTSATVADRVMHGQAQEAVAQTATFVSSTNKHIYDTLPDPSGMRRYWEFQIKLPKGVLPDFEKANEIFDNIQGFYKAIDESEDKGFYHPSRPEYANMVEMQSNWVRQDSLARYVSSMKWVFCDQDDVGAYKMPMRKLMQGFNSALKMAEGSGQTGWKIDRIRRQLSATHIDVIFDDAAVAPEPTEYYWVKPKTVS